MRCFLWDVIVTTWPNFHGGLTKPLLKLGMIEYIPLFYMDVIINLRPNSDVV